MLDKTLEYSGFSKSRRPGWKLDKNQLPNPNFRRVKIIFEDDISWYVQSLTKMDNYGNGIRYSVKKSCFILKTRSEPLKAFSKFWTSCFLHHPSDFILDNGKATWKEALRWLRKEIGRKGVACLEDIIRKELGEE